MVSQHPEMDFLSGPRALVPHPARFFLFTSLTLVVLGGTGSARGGDFASTDFAVAF
jgi:hypothetical protein